VNLRLWNATLLLLSSFNALPSLAAESLYQAGAYQALTSDLRMRRVGDLITVMVYESASASSTANTSAARDAGVNLDVQGTRNGYSASIGAANHTDGRGRTQREGRVLAQLTVYVHAIAANGDLTIKGQQLVDINNERQEITVEGRIRPHDVSDTNVVLSTRIANARIRYTGQGDMADKQRPAWWQRFLTLFGV
jgi:flagellar L-ring protein precursor FlgH